MSSFLAQEWIKAASLDIASIPYIIKDDNLSSVVAFHSQQAIEKSIKAFYEFALDIFNQAYTLIDIYTEKIKTK